MAGFHSCRAPAAMILIAYCVFCAPGLATAEIVKLSSPQSASLRGYIYVDLNRNTQLEIGEAVIDKVVVRCTMTATLNGTSLSGQYPTYETTTDERGQFYFDQMMPGVYSVTETQPVEFLPGLPGPPGTVRGTCVGTTKSSNEFVDVRLAAGDNGIMYNFGEYGLRSAYLSKRHLLKYSPEVPEYEGDVPIPEPAGAMFLATGLFALLGSAAGLRRHRP